MTVRAKIASVILFILVAVSYHYKGFTIGNNISGYVMLLLFSLGMLLVFTTSLNVWLKLFLFGGIISSILSNNPVQAGVSMSWIILFMLMYYYLTTFTFNEIKYLLSFVVTIVLIQAGWVLIETIGYRAGRSEHIDVIGTIGYRNLVSLLLASTTPLVIMYRKKMAIPALIVWWFVRSLTSTGALIISLWVYFFKKSKVYILITAIGIIYLGYFGVTKLLYNYGGNGRLAAWKETVYLIKKHPVAGSGFGLKRSVRLKNVQSRFAHNTFLELTEEGGLITSVPIFLFIGDTFISFIRSAKTKLQRAVFGSLSGFYVGMMFSFPDRNVAMVLIMIVILAGHQVLFRRIT